MHFFFFTSQFYKHRPLVHVFVTVVVVPAAQVRRTHIATFSLVIFQWIFHVISHFERLLIWNLFQKNCEKLNEMRFDLKERKKLTKKCIAKLKLLFISAQFDHMLPSATTNYNFAKQQQQRARNCVEFSFWSWAMGVHVQWLSAIASKCTRVCRSRRREMRIARVCIRATEYDEPLIYFVHKAFRTGKQTFEWIGNSNFSHRFSLLNSVELISHAPQKRVTELKFHF